MEKPLHFVFCSFRQKCGAFFGAKFRDHPLDKSGEKGTHFHGVISGIIYTMSAYILHYIWEKDPVSDRNQRDTQKGEENCGKSTNVKKE